MELISALKSFVASPSSVVRMLCCDSDSRFIEYLGLFVSTLPKRSIGWSRVVESAGLLHEVVNSFFIVLYIIIMLKN